MKERGGSGVGINMENILFLFFRVVSSHIFFNFV